MLKKKAKGKTPLPNGILKNKEFLRMVDILIDCRSRNREKVSRAIDAACEIAADFEKPTMVDVCAGTDMSGWKVLKAERLRKMGDWTLVTPPHPPSATAKGKVKKSAEREAEVGATA